MLLLDREPGERIRADTSDGPIWITLVRPAEQGRSATKIGIDAPDSVSIAREEALPEAERRCRLRSYRTEELARRTADRLARAGKLAPGWTLEPFRCPRCGAFHNSRAPLPDEPAPAIKLRA